MPQTIIKHASKTALTLIAFAFLFTMLLAYIYQVTKLPIAQSEAEARIALFSQILPQSAHDNDILNDTISIAPNALLGNKNTTVANRARINGTPSAIVLEAIAPDGYKGDIKLLIAIGYDGTILGVRVIAHNETPGLGDYIDIAKSDWIKTFSHQSLSNTSEKDWKVKKDGGQFDYMAGATITPRAVVKAVHKALLYFQQNKDVLFT